MNTTKFDILEKLVAQSAARIRQLERENELLALQADGLNTELKKFQNSQSEVRRLNSARETMKRKLAKLAGRLEAAISEQENSLRTAYGLNGRDSLCAGEPPAEPVIAQPPDAGPEQPPREPGTKPEKPALAEQQPYQHPQPANQSTPAIPEPARLPADGIESAQENTAPESYETAPQDTAASVDLSEPNPGQPPAPEQTGTTAAIRAARRAADPAEDDLPLFRAPDSMP
ncbi:MAG: hypothetical protein PHW69_02160 [Elusimicrobiaceae bacterium]|nr:hypothetical protein [Elusimicrobiaceae bacterium]